MIDYSWYISYLIENKHPFLIMAGEYDLQDGAKGMTVWMKQNLLGLRDEFWSQARMVYKYMDQTFNELHVGGYYRT